MEKHMSQQAVLYGIEGGCLACYKPISAHVDNHGNWVGCPVVGPDTAFLLVPTRIAPYGRKTVVAAPAPVVTATKRVTVGTHGHKPKGHRPHWKYQVRDGRVRPALTEPQGVVYDTLKGMGAATITQVAQKTQRSIESTRRMVLSLVERNWVRREAMPVKKASAVAQEAAE